MKKILQIIPADNWEVTFSDVAGEPVDNNLVVCFALVEEDGHTNVEGMYSQEGFIDFCEDVSNFNGYIKHNRK